MSLPEKPVIDLTEQWNEDQAAEVEAMQPQRTPCEIAPGSLAEAYRVRMEKAELAAGLMRMRIMDLQHLIELVLRLPECKEQHYTYKGCALCAAKRIAAQNAENE